MWGVVKNVGSHPLPASHSLFPFSASHFNTEQEDWWNPADKHILVVSIYTNVLFMHCGCFQGMWIETRRQGWRPNTEVAVELWPNNFFSSATAMTGISSCYTACQRDLPSPPGVLAWYANSCSARWPTPGHNSMLLSAERQPNNVAAPLSKLTTALLTY